MHDIKILPLIVNLMTSFFRSSRDALHRARRAKSDQASTVEPTGLNIFSHCREQTQASVESIVFSFLTIEATVNYLFFEQQLSPRSLNLSSWLRQNWKRRLSVNDRFLLLVSLYSTAELDKYKNLVELLSEFVRFRNRIVHAHPEQYFALVEPGPIQGEVLVHDVEPIDTTRSFPASGLSEELGRINVQDASRAFEIMLIILSFLDEQFVAEFELPWPSKQPPREEEQLSPRRILESLSSRHYPTIDPESFVPDIIANLRKGQPPSEGEGA